MNLIEVSPEFVKLVEEILVTVSGNVIVVSDVHKANAVDSTI